MKKLAILLLHVIIVLFTGVWGIPVQESSEPEALRIKHEGIELHCFFHGATGEGPFPTIILMQGWPSGGRDSLQIGATLAGSGINSLTLHYRGTFLSEGISTFQDLFIDLNFIFNLLHTEEFQKKYKIDTSKIIVGGHSFGGAVSLTVAANNPQIKYVFGIGFPDHSQFARELATDAKLSDEMIASFVKMEAPEGPIRGGVELLRDLIENPDIHDLRKFAPCFKGKKILMVGGWEDSGATVDNHLLPFYRALKKAKVADVKFIVYHTNHSFRNVRKQLANDILEWILTI